MGGERVAIFLEPFQNFAVFDIYILNMSLELFEIGSNNFSLNIVVILYIKVKLFVNHIQSDSFFD